MCKQYLILSLAVCLLSGVAARADYIDAVKKGNESFVKKDYMKALEQYHAAETDLPASPELDYDIAGALFEQGKYENAVDKFTHALNTTDPLLAARAHYNLGNTYYRMQDYEKSIKSYEESLKLNPKDMDAKFNLELARKMLKEHSQAKQGNQQQQKQQQQQDQQQKQDQQDKDKKDKDQQQQSQSDSTKNKDQQQQKQQQANPKDEKKMSKEDAERILNALKDKEQDAQKKLKRQVMGGEYNGKDW